MIKEVLSYGHPVLRKKCSEVLKITDEIIAIARDLEETVLYKNGAGLAAPQIGYEKRMFVCCYENELDSKGLPILCNPKLYINPVLKNPSETKDIKEEGCLSIPGIFSGVSRPCEVFIEAMTLEGNKFSEHATGWKARCIFHENDHLNGVLFIDRLPQSKKKGMQKSLTNLKKKFKNSLK